MAIGKVLKVGAVALSAAGGVAGGVEVVTTIVEQHNYEYQHVINEEHTYWIGGVKVTEAEYLAYLTGVDATTLYYGAVTDLTNFTLADLTEVEFAGDSFSYNFTTVVGDIDRYEEEVAPDYGNQYLVFALPEEYNMISLRETSNPYDTGNTFNTITVGTYDVSYWRVPFHRFEGITCVVTWTLD